MSAQNHSHIVLEDWSKLQRLTILENKNAVVVRGEKLTLADVVAVARHGTTALIDESPELQKRVDRSVSFLRQCVDEGEILYGGFPVKRNDPSLIKFPSSRHKHRVWRKCQYTHQ